MRTSSLVTFAAAAAAALSSLGLAQDAPITQNNPAMASLQATLQADKNIQGSITGVSNTNGTGVNFNVNFYNFPSSGGPFSYYIAEGAVPTSNTCTSLTTPFNPYSASSGQCKATAPSTCAIGALSGKHGSISDSASDSSFQEYYLDLYLSTSPHSESYFGGRAIVVADSGGTPVNCANFPGTMSSASGGSSSSSSSSSMASATSTASASGAGVSASAAAAAAPPTAAPPRRLGSGVALVAAVAVLVM